MNKYLLFLLLFIGSNCFAQNIIKGKVIDETTQEAIAGVNVYINNSSTGTTTDSLGNFHFSTSLTGKIELIISHLLYQKKMITVASNEANHLNLSLKKQENTLNEVVINGKKPSKETIKKWQLLFAINLMGNYQQIDFSKSIKNPEVLVFNFFDDTNELQVTARAPLLIENKLLGYEIKLDLDLFSYNFNTNMVIYRYSLFFKDKNLENYKLKDLQQLRRLYYYGSSMHLMRSMYAGQLAAEGFALYHYKAIKNKEKARVIKLINQRIAEEYGKNVSPQVDLEQLFRKKDTANYYSTVLMQYDDLSFDTIPVVLPKLIKPDSTLHTAQFYTSDTLMVSYQSTFAQLQKSLPFKAIPRYEVYQGNQKKYTLESKMYFFKKEPINIQKNGYYPELSLFISGNMAQRKLGVLVPMDFDPDLP